MCHIQVSVTHRGLQQTNGEPRPQPRPACIIYGRLVVALAQQQHNDAVARSLLQQYHHSLLAAPWAECGDSKFTENSFLGACLSLLK